MSGASLAAVPASAVAATGPVVDPSAERSARGEGRLPVSTREPLVLQTSAELACNVLWSDGTPAEGVRLELWHEHFDEVKPHPLAATDAQGVARFADLDPGEAFVFADRFSDSEGRGQIVLVAGPNELELRLPAGLTVEGLVLDADDQPVAKAQLWLAGHAQYDGGGLWIDTADANGRFRLRDVESGHSLAARASGHAAGTPIVCEGEPGATVRATLHVGPRGPRVRGIVRSEGAPLAGALVFLGSTQDTRYTIVDGVKTRFAPPPQWLSTDEGGRFEGECVPAGKVLPVWAGASGCATWHENVEVGESPFLEIELERAAAVSGSVRDEEGKPASSCQVGALQRGLDPERLFDFGAPAWARGETWTRSDGSFRLERLHAGAVTLFAQKDTSESRVDRELRPGEEQRWDAVLRSGRDIEGVVIGEDGLAVPGVRVGASSEAIPPTHHLRGCTTDSDGWFRLQEATREAYSLRLSMDSDLDAAIEIDGVAPGSEPLEIVFPDRCRPSARFTGRLLDPRGAALTPDFIRIRRLEPDSRESTGGSRTRCEDGRFETGLLPPGSYRLTFTAAATGDWSVGPFDLVADEVHDLGTLQSSEPGVIQCRVLDASGASLAEGEIFATRGHDFGRSTKVVLGSARFEDLASGTYWVGFRGYGEPLIRVPVELHAGTTSEVVLRWPATLSRWIQVPEAPAHRFVVCAIDWRRDGVLVAHEDVGIGPGRQRPLEMQLEPGHYEVVITLENGRSATTSFEVDATTTGQDQAIVLRSPF
jgi:hypothetical protein